STETIVSGRRRLRTFAWRASPALALLAACGAHASASPAAEPIRIGAVFSESGGFGSIGSPGLAGMRLAAAQINREGGVLRRRVRIVAADSRSRPRAVARVVKRLIED